LEDHTVFWIIFSHGVEKVVERESFLYKLISWKFIKLYDFDQISIIALHLHKCDIFWLDVRVTVFLLTEKEHKLE
jgi:hypothetical protein